MGTLERQARATRRLRSFQQGLLVAAAVGGIVMVSAAAPNTLQLLRYLPGYKDGARFKYQAKTALGRLAAKGLVSFEERQGRYLARITESGKKMLERAVLEKKHTQRKRWDRRWRVVVFDVPVRRKGVRDRLRTRMKELGFMLLQQSVWVHPYDCEDLIALVKAECRLGGNVLYMVVEHIEHDGSLRRHFSV